MCYWYTLVWLRHELILSIPGMPMEEGFISIVSHSYYPQGIVNIQCKKCPQICLLIYNPHLTIDKCST